MSRKKINDYLDIKEIIVRIKQITGLRQYQIAEQIFNITDKNLSNKVSRGTIDLDVLIDWSRIQNVDLNWLFHGEGDIYRSDANNLNRKIVDLPHQDLVTKFKNKPLAREINQDLLELEQIDEKSLEDVRTFVKGMVTAFRRTHKKESENHG